MPNADGSGGALLVSGRVRSRPWLLPLVGASTHAFARGIARSTRLAETYLAKTGRDFVYSGCRVKRAGQTGSCTCSRCLELAVFQRAFFLAMCEAPRHGV